MRRRGHEGFEAAGSCFFGLTNLRAYLLAGWLAESTGCIALHSAKVVFFD